MNDDAVMRWRKSANDDTDPSLLDHGDWREIIIVLADEVLDLRQKLREKEDEK